MESEKRRLLHNLKIYIKAPICALILITSVLIINNLFGVGDDDCLEILLSFIAYTTCFYIVCLLVGFPLVALLGKKRLSLRALFVAVGLLVGFIVAGLFDAFRFNSIGSVYGYILYAIAGGLTGYYTYYLISEK